MTDADKMSPANDAHHAVDLLIAAYRISADTTTRHYIELALLHEGRKISSVLSPDEMAEQLDRTGTGFKTFA